MCASSTSAVEEGARVQGDDGWPACFIGAAGGEMGSDGRAFLRGRGSGESCQMIVDYGRPTI